MDEKTGKHIRFRGVDTFRGNLRFSSLNSLYFKTTSRRDDLISLCYMMIYAINRGHMYECDSNPNLT